MTIAGATLSCLPSHLLPYAQKSIVLTSGCCNQLIGYAPSYLQNDILVRGPLGQLACQPHANDLGALQLPGQACVCIPRFLISNFRFCRQKLIHYAAIMQPHSIPSLHTGMHTPASAQTRFFCGTTEVLRKVPARMGTFRLHAYAHRAKFSGLVREPRPAKALLLCLVAGMPKATNMPM